MDQVSLDTAVSLLSSLGARADRFAAHIRIDVSGHSGQTGYSVSLAQGLLDIRLPGAFEVPFDLGFQASVRSAVAVAVPLMPKAVLVGFMDCGAFRPRLVALAERNGGHARQISARRQQIQQWVNSVNRAA